MGYKFINITTYLFAGIMLFLLTGCSSTGSLKSGLDKNETTSMDDILSKMPADNADDGISYNTRTMEMAPNSIRYLCSLLVPPGTGDDTNARFAINGLASHVFRPGAEKERKVYSAAIIEALNSAADNEVKAFLIRQLQVAGGNEAAAPLGKLLADDILCEPAAQALRTIGTYSADAEFIKALPKVNNMIR